MKKNKRILLGLSLVATLLIGGALISLGESHFAWLAGSATDEHDANCHWNHYDEVLPNETVHGSKEFWACCEHHEYSLELPTKGTITDLGAFSGTYFDELDPKDPRYLAPLGLHTYSLSIGNGEPIVLDNFNDTLTEADSCVARYGLDGVDLNRGDVLTFYRDGAKITEVSAEEGSNARIRVHPNNYEKYDLMIQTPGTDFSIHLNLYGDGGLKCWVSGYDDHYFQVLYLVRDGVGRYIDFNLRLDQAWVHDDYTGEDLPTGWLDLYLQANDEIRFVRYRWWTKWTSLGDGWNNYVTKDGVSDPYLNRVLRSGRFFCGCEGFRGLGTSCTDVFALGWMEKDYYVNGEKISRTKYTYDGDQVRVELALGVGDIVYIGKIKADETEKVLGWTNIDPISPAYSYLKSSGDNHIQIKEAGVYYFASWYDYIYIEKR